MKNTNQIGRGYIEMVAAMIMMGTVGVFVVESGQSAQNVVFFRCLFGTVFLAVYCYLRGFFRNTGLTRNVLLLLVVSGIFLVFNWVLLFASFETASISTSTVIYHTQPLFFVLIGVVVFRENITLDKVLWIVLAFIGVVLVSNIEIDAAEFSMDRFRGVLYALVAAMFWAIAAMIVKRLNAIKPHLIALIQVFVGIFVLYPFATIESVSSASPIQWSYLVALGAIHTCLTYILMYSAFQKLQTAVIAVLTYIYPVVAILADYIVYDEILTYLQILGVIMILFSSFAVSQNIVILRRKQVQQ